MPLVPEMSRTANATGLTGAEGVEFEHGLTPSQQAGIRRGVQQGIRDIERGLYQDYDCEGLRALAKELVAAAAGASTRNEARAWKRGGRGQAEGKKGLNQGTKPLCALE
jgi:hypothetical protein